MNLLAGKLYDPAAAVTKSTASLLALTALDTTNLRLSFVVPPSGIVRVRLAGTLHGATTFPQIILGVLESATVRGRMAPMTGGGNLAATTMQCAEAIFLVTGLTPAASLTWDAAYGVETIVAATGLKYGGPNNTTANDNFGGFAFEIWDPCPIYTPASGAAPTSPVSTRIDTIQTTDTAIKTKTDFLPSATAGAAGGVFIAGANAATSITTALTANITGNLSGSVGSVTGAVGSVTGLTASNLDAAVSSRMATYTQPTGFLAATFPTTVASTTNITAGTITTTTNLTNLPSIPANWITAAGITAAALNGKGDWNIGKTGYSLTQTFPTNFSALAVTAGGAVTAGTVSDKTGYSLTTAPLDAAATRAAVGLAAANLDAQLATLLPTASYTAPDNTSITAIKAKTDSLGFSTAGYADVNIRYINSVSVTGSGTAGVPWGPV